MNSCILLLALQCAFNPTFNGSVQGFTRVGPQPMGPPAAMIVAPVDTPRARPRAIEYSDWYDRRLTIHRWGSYTMLPLFAGEYYLGNRMYNEAFLVPSWVRTTHRGVAYGIGALFTLNTVTGVWNLWDSRNDPAGRTRRWIHTGLMLASDAGFAWAGTKGSGIRSQSQAQWRQHRNIALGSIGLATLGTAYMWFTNK